jgi:hypothetical protein
MPAPTRPDRRNAKSASPEPIDGHERRRFPAARLASICIDVAASAP